VRIPPRPFLSSAAAQQEEKIHDIMGRLVEAALIHGGPHYGELRAVLHILHHVWVETKKTAREIGRALEKGGDE
jgi:hypothetical protein